MIKEAKLGCGRGRMPRPRALPAWVAALLCAACASRGPAGASTAANAAVSGTTPGAAAGAGPTLFIRVNQVGYLPEGPKVAVACGLAGAPAPDRFVVVDGAGKRVLGPARAETAGAFGPCVATYRLDFSAVRTPGTYRVVAGDVASPTVRVSADAYAGAADTLLMYMREQRSGFNPLFRDSVHNRTDGILVDHPDSGTFVPTAGGWADAADYLQYATTSANATMVMLMAYRDHPSAFTDRHDHDGLPGANGVADVLDEARHGLEWLVKMYPRDDLLLNQIADDRDHAFPDLPTTDSSDYGWGKGGYRPVYPCTGRPQGLFKGKSRSTGYASTAGKFASAMALGSRLLQGRDPAFADTLRRKAIAAYELGRQHPGVCQTAPGRSPYFYEEDNWVDDMELGAAELYALTREPRYRTEALEYAAREPVTPWMGRDTANHYQWFPWHNNGHYEAWRLEDAAGKKVLASYYRAGLERVAARAKNGFRVGIPFIWCSNNLMASFATQAYLYRAMTGDTRYQAYEAAALDWLFGTNPWGVSMIVGYPAGGRTPTDPHSIVSMRLGWRNMTGGLVDGPVYRSIYEHLLGIALHEPDEYAPFNTGFIVYHDDLGDYSTNEPIMDGTANLTYLLAAMAAVPAGGAPAR
ncbi:MAG TPA: glycoside hydrolase family 9 protein [Longimicrobiales bacterium]|nr:glycoside hydrolase family 9 protein [Longimicrobiales bacterium]